MRIIFSISKTAWRYVDVRSKAMTAIRKKYSARIKSVLNLKVKNLARETQELLDESILIRATIEIPRDMRRLNVTEGIIKKST